MKVVILVIASEGEAYNKFLENWRSQIRPANISIFFLFCSEHVKNPVEIKDDSIYIRGKESFKPGIYYKTLEGMRWALTEPFDYLIRTNLSSYINLQALNQFLGLKPRQNCMVGTFVSGGFLSGAGYGMSRDVVEDFIGWCENECEINAAKHFDDEFVGFFRKERDIPLLDMGLETYDESMTLEKAVEKLHIRFKSNHQSSNGCIRCSDWGKNISRTDTGTVCESCSKDTERHKNVIDQYNMKSDDKNLVFYIPHYRSSDLSVSLLNHCVKAIQLHYPSSDIVVCESQSASEKSSYDISGDVDR